jgi:hypothetical protein
MVAWPLLPWTTSSTAVVASPLLPSSSLAQQKRVMSDQVQEARYFESDVETFAATLELETSSAALELETNTTPLELETDLAPLELETETDVSQEISKQERYSAD